jgi:hypothetical protein
VPAVSVSAPRALCFTHAASPPHRPSLQTGPPDAAALLAGAHAYHIVAVGTQECGRSAAASVLPALPSLCGAATTAAAPSHPCASSWEAALAAGLGGAYYHVASSSVGAIHLSVHALRALKPHVTDVQTGAVPCGLGRVAGNKGGVAVGCAVGGTRLVFVNCHLAAHAHAVGARNRDAARIDACLPLVPASLRVGDRARARVAAHVRQLAAAVGDLQRERARAAAAAAAAAAATAAGSHSGGTASSSRSSGERFSSLVKAAWAAMQSPPTRPALLAPGGEQSRPPALSAPAPTSCASAATAPLFTTTASAREGQRRPRRGLSSFLFHTSVLGGGRSVEDGNDGENESITAKRTALCAAGTVAASSQSAESPSTASRRDGNDAAAGSGDDADNRGTAVPHQRLSQHARASSYSSLPSASPALPVQQPRHRKSLTVGTTTTVRGSSGTSVWGSFSNRIFRTSARVVPACDDAAASAAPCRVRLLPAAAPGGARAECDDVTGGSGSGSVQTLLSEGGASAAAGSASSGGGCVCEEGSRAVDDDDSSSDFGCSEDGDEFDGGEAEGAGDTAPAAAGDNAPADARHRRHVGNADGGFGSNATAVRVPTAAAEQQQAAASDELLLGVLSALLRSLHVPAALSARYDRVVWMGDLNYRLLPPPPPTGQGDVTTGDDGGAGSSSSSAAAAVRVADGSRVGSVGAHHALLAAGDLPALLALDQLAAERAGGRVFAGFEEPPLRFAPT